MMTMVDKIVDNDPALTRLKQRCSTAGTPGRRIMQVIYKKRREQLVKEHEERVKNIEVSKLPIHLRNLLPTMHDPCSCGDMHSINCSQHPINKQPRVHQH